MTGQGLSERGSVLLYSLIASALVLSCTIWYTQTTWNRGRQVGLQIERSRATQYAESGVNGARQWLKAPDFAIKMLPGSTTSFSYAPDELGRYDISLTRLSTDSSLVDAYSTGYFYIPTGGLVDPQTNRHIRRSVIHARYQVSNASAFVFALPNDLTIDAGSDLGDDGKVYASELTFAPPPNGVTTKLGAAFYYSSVAPSEAPAGISFGLAPNHAQQLSSPLNLPALDGEIRDSYYNIRSPTVPSSFSGLIADVPNFPVYFIDDNVDLAQGGDLMISGVFVIYSTGTITIHGNIRLADATSWVGILAEKDIRIAADAPPNLEINASIFTSRSFISDAVYPTNGSLSINGGITCLQNISIGAQNWKTRSYRYQTSTDPRLRLPNFSEVVNYQVLVGN